MTDDVKEPSKDREDGVIDKKKLIRLWEKLDRKRKERNLLRKMKKESNNAKV